jgi:hypothetical protein
MGFETDLGVFTIAAGLFTGARQITHGGICYLGYIDDGERTRARQAGQWHGGAAGGVDASTRFGGNQRGRHHPAIVAFLRQRAVELRAARTGCVAEEELLGLGSPLADAWIDSTLTGADGPKRGDSSAVSLRHVSHGHRLLVDLHAEAECARLGHG